MYHTSLSPRGLFPIRCLSVHSHKAWRLAALKEPLSGGSHGTRLQGQAQGLLWKQAACRLLLSNLYWEGHVFSNKMFLSCLLAYILLWYYRSLVSKRVLRRHKERFSGRRYSTLREKNTSCFYPPFLPGNGWPGSWLAKGRSVPNRNRDRRKQGLMAGT